MPALYHRDSEVAFNDAKQDDSICEEFEDLVANYVGRPTAL